MAIKASHSTLITFALGNNLNEEADKYRESSKKESALMHEIEQTARKGSSPQRARQIEEELQECSKKADEAKTFRDRLRKVYDAFEGLEDTEKLSLDKRLNDKSKNLELVLRNRRSGEILAQAS